MEKYIIKYNDYQAIFAWSMGRKKISGLLTPTPLCYTGNANPVSTLYTVLSILSSPADQNSSPRKRQMFVTSIRGERGMRKGRWNTYTLSTESFLLSATDVRSFCSLLIVVATSHLAFPMVAGSLSPSCLHRPRLLVTR